MGKLSYTTSQVNTVIGKGVNGEYANLTGGNGFTGNQTVTDGLFNQKSTTAQVNKREYSWKVEFAGYVLNALDDVGTVVRNLFQVFHDGGVRIFGNLTVDGTLSVPTTVTTITSGFASGWSGVIQFSKSGNLVTADFAGLAKDVMPTSGEIIYTAPVGLRPPTANLVRIEPLNSAGSITFETATIEFNQIGQLIIYHNNVTTFRRIGGVRCTYYTA